MYSDDGEKEGIVMKRIPTACCSCVIVFLTLTSLIVPSTCPAGDEKGSASKATQAETRSHGRKMAEPDGDYVWSSVT